VLALYGPEDLYLDYDFLQAEVCREQEELAFLEERHHTLRLQTVRPLYRQIHPRRHLETIRGVGQDGAAVYTSFIAAPQRFATTALFRGWTGMVPDSRQSAQSEGKGLPLSKAWPDLIKKFAYLDVEVGWRCDPQLAAIYYDQMVHKGKHHTQAVCACVTRLLDRVFAVLRDDKPYELRNVDGTPLTPEQAQVVIAARYTVPEGVRQRRNKRTRQAGRTDGQKRKTRGKVPRDS
jgi:hypothetical protein